MTSFRREEDARRAVDAVNAQVAQEAAEEGDCPHCGHANADHVAGNDGDPVACARMVVSDIRGGADECGCPGGLPEPTIPPSCDCPTTDGAAHDGDTCQSADSDLESAQGELNEARLWLARRGVEVQAHRSLTRALNEAERAGVVDRPADPADTQRAAPTRDVLVDAFDEYAGRGALSLDSEALADVALAALRDGGADTGGEGEAPASSAERLRRAADALAARASEWYGSAAVADAINKLVYEARRVAAEPWVTRADGYELCNEPHPDGKHRPCVKTQGHNAHRDGRGDFWESLRTTPDEAAIARLARALGVSLDPDDPDPVERLVEAAGKAREWDPECTPDCQDCGLCSSYGHLRCWVHDSDGGDGELRSLLLGVDDAIRFDSLRSGTGGHFRHLCWGTMRVRPGRDWLIELDDYGDGIELDSRNARELAASLLAALDLPVPAPAPAPAALAVGEVVTGDRAVTAPVGTKLGAQSAAVAAVRTTGGWSVTAMGHEQDHEHAVRINEWVVLALGGGS